MAAIAKLHAARQPPIPLKPVTEFHHYPTARVTTQFDVTDRLVKGGVLSPTDRSAWISGTFIIPKKDDTIRWVSDF